MHYSIRQRKVLAAVDAAVRDKIRVVLLVCALLLGGAVTQASASVYYVNVSVSPARMGEWYSVEACAAWDDSVNWGETPFDHADFTIYGTNGSVGYGSSTAPFGDCVSMVDYGSAPGVVGYWADVTAYYADGSQDFNAGYGEGNVDGPPNCCLRFTFNSFLPFDHIDDPAHTAFMMAYWGKSGDIFEGDNRSYFSEWGSARTAQAFSMDNPVYGGGNLVYSSGLPWVNQTRVYEKATSLTAPDGWLTDDAKNDWVPYPPMKTAWGTAASNGDCTTARTGPNGWVVNLHCWIAIPNGVYWFDPDIMYTVDVSLDFSGGWHVPYTIDACTKLFPAYEFYISNIFGGHLLGVSHLNISNYPISLMVDACANAHESGVINY